MKSNEHIPQQSTQVASKAFRWRRWLFAAMALPVIYVTGVLAYELNREHFPRLDLPAFDHTKAKGLTPERRAAYEQELFSELQQWNRGSRKYPTLEDIERREQRWQQMADDGFELAHITLSVLKPKGGLVYSLSDPMKRLVELAEQGDAGAMCLMPGLVGKATLKLNTDAYAATYKSWLERGAAIGHPECQKALGGRLLRGVDGYEQSTSRGLSLIFAARRSGYRIGTRINIDVLNAQQQLHAAQRDLFKARTDTLLQSLRLKAAVGDLHADALQALNQLLMTDGAGAVNNPPTSSPTP